MAKTGIELPKIESTGIDKENIKIHLDYQSETNKLNFEFKDKWLEKIFSPNFLSFIVTILIVISGFVFMRVEGVTKTEIIEFWKSIFPFVSIYIGYAIGKGK